MKGGSKNSYQKSENHNQRHYNSVLYHTGKSERNILSIVNEDQISNLNGPVTHNEREVVIRRLLTPPPMHKKLKGQKNSTQKFTKPSKINPILLKLFHESEAKGTFPKSFL